MEDVMHGAWTRFIADGDPGWQRYDLEQRTTMVFDSESGAVDNPAAAEREAWDGIR